MMTGRRGRLLLFGGSGQLGNEITRSWTGWDILAPTRASIDFCDPSMVERAIREFRPSVVFNATAFHNVDACEADPVPAFAVNSLAVDSAAKICASAGCVFVTISTDYVFAGDGTLPLSETSVALPRNAYGVSKLSGELLVPRHGGRHFILRTSGLYGPTASTSKGYTFAHKILAQAREGQPIKVVDDMTFSPSFAGHVASAAEALIRTGRFGLYHVANKGQVTWFDFARELLLQSALQAHIEPISYKTWNSRTFRPPYSALDVSKAASVGVHLPPWQEGVRAFLKRLSAETARASGVSEPGP